MVLKSLLAVMYDFQTEILGEKGLWTLLLFYKSLSEASCFSESFKFRGTAKLFQGTCYNFYPKVGLGLSLHMLH